MLRCGHVSPLPVKYVTLFYTLSIQLFVSFLPCIILYMTRSHGIFLQARRVMMIILCYWNASKTAVQHSFKPSSFTWKRSIGSAHKNIHNAQISIPLFTRIRRKKWHIIWEWDRENWSVILTLSFRRFYSLQRHISYNLLFLHVIASFHNLKNHFFFWWNFLHFFWKFSNIYSKCIAVLNIKRLCLLISYL